MTCSYEEHGATHTVEIVVDGKVTEEDMDSILPKMETFIEGQTDGGHKVKIIEIIKDFGGFEWSTLGRGMRFDWEHMKDFSHVAIVTDEGWIGPATQFMASFLPIDVRVFPMKELGEARAWITHA